MMSPTKPPSLPDMADTQPFQLDTQMVVAQLLQDELVVCSTKPGPVVQPPPSANQEPCQPLGPLPELSEAPATAEKHDQARDMASNVSKDEAIPESSKPTFEPLSSPEKASAGCMFAVLRMLHIPSLYVYSVLILFALEVLTRNDQLTLKAGKYAAELEEAAAGSAKGGKGKRGKGRGGRGKGGKGRGKKGKGGKGKGGRGRGGRSKTSPEKEEAKSAVKTRAGAFKNKKRARATKVSPKKGRKACKISKQANVLDDGVDNVCCRSPQGGGPALQYQARENPKASQGYQAQAGALQAA